MILILVSQRAEVQAIQLFGPEWMVKELEKELLKQRGNGPTYLEIVVVVYVLGKSPVKKNRVTTNNRTQAFILTPRDRQLLYRKYKTLLFTIRRIKRHKLKILYVLNGR